MDLSALFNDPEVMQQLSEMGIFPDSMDLMGQQMKRAEALRGTPGAQGREVGNTYVASSPLEHLAVGLQRTLGQQGINNTAGQQNDLLQRMRGSVMDQARAMARALRGGAGVDQMPAGISVPEMY